MLEKKIIFFHAVKMRSVPLPQCAAEGSKKAGAGGRFILDPGNGKNLHVISLWEYAVLKRWNVS